MVTTGTGSGKSLCFFVPVGFDDVAPNEARDISSRAYDFAASQVEIIDNRALGVACYHPGHTLVEKLQAISSKFRQQ